MEELLGRASDARVPCRVPASPNASVGWSSSIPTRCTGCAICKFRCTSRAIDFKGGKGEFTWSYDPGQCTFCGRCVEGCKDHALSQCEDTPPVYTTLGELKKSYTVARKATVKPAADGAARSGKSAGHRCRPYCFLWRC